MRRWCDLSPATWLIIRKRLSQGVNIRQLSRMMRITRKVIYKVKAGVPAIRYYLDCPRCGHRNRLRDRHCRKCHKRLYSGMVGQIKRAGNEVAFVIKDALAGSTPLDYAPWAGARITIPEGSSITALSFYEGPSFGKETAETDPETFVECAGVTLTVEAGKSYELPAALYAAHALVIVGDDEGDATIRFKG